MARSVSVRIITERDTGRSKGFAFLEMPEREEALKAIENLNGSELDGRALKVNESQPRTGSMITAAVAAAVAAAAAENAGNTVLNQKCRICNGSCTFFVLKRIPDLFPVDFDLQRCPPARSTRDQLKRWR